MWPPPERERWRLHRGHDTAAAMTAQRLTSDAADLSHAYTERDEMRTGERLAHRAVELAEALLRDARAQQTPDEHAQARKLARMMADPNGKALTIALADQAF